MLPRFILMNESKVGIPLQSLKYDPHTVEEKRYQVKQNTPFMMHIPKWSWDLLGTESIETKISRWGPAEKLPFVFPIYFNWISLLLWYLLIYQELDSANNIERKPMPDTKNLNCSALSCGLQHCTAHYCTAL